MTLYGIFFAVVLALIGAATNGTPGFFFGAILGYAFGGMIELLGAYKKLHAMIWEIKEQIDAVAPEQTVTTRRTAAAPPPLRPMPSPPSEVSPPEPTVFSPPRAEQVTAQGQGYERHATTATSTQPPVSRAASVDTTGDGNYQHQEDIFDRLAARIQGFFTDGNLIAKVGLIVLFFGIGFLVKYAAEHSLFPLELRFGVAAVIGIILLVLGWRMRNNRTVFGLLLQGGGVGVLYVTVFAAAKLFNLLPLGLTLAVMIALVAFSALLSVLQNAKYLAIYGAIGGFLAPILTSTGAGSHVMLFSYYALLNLGIVSIAWYRAWRELNLLGFVFTFLIGCLWGAKYYVPEFFPSVEPFLILFFLMFLAVTVLFAVRQAPNLKSYVDSTLVFGVPIAGFALQSALVRDMEYGLAITALTVSAIYIFLAVLLWRRAADSLRLLTESFLALGVVFGTLAIPFALDGRWTSAAWALEGAAIIWVGVRQDRLLARLFGIFLQICAGVAYLGVIARQVQGTNDLVLTWVKPLSAPVGGWMILNSVFLGAVMISFAGLFSSYYLYRHKDKLRMEEESAHIFLLVWGLLWWFGAGYREIIEFMKFDDLVAASLGFFAGSMWLLQRLERRLAWTPMQYPLLGLIIGMYTLMLVSFGQQHAHPFDLYGVIVWPLAFVIQYLFLYQYRKELQHETLQWQHVMTYWLAVFTLSWEGAWLVAKYIDGGTWRDVTWFIVPAMLSMLLFTLGPRVRWPLVVHHDWYIKIASLPVMVVLWLAAVLYSANHAGDPWPLDVYIPLLNPLDLAILFILFTLVRWSMEMRAVTKSDQHNQLDPVFNYAVGLAVFVWLTGTVARSVHHWLGIDYNLLALNGSVEFHSALSVVWTVSALILTIVATRAAKRALWFVGGGLLLLVVFKLFFVDLASSGTLARIISFITVGLLLLLINHFSPIPPRQQETSI